jgi:hypothetical protein
MIGSRHSKAIVTGMARYFDSYDSDDIHWSTVSDFFIEHHSIIIHSFHTTRSDDLSDFREMPLPASTRRLGPLGYVAVLLGVALFFVLRCNWSVFKPKTIFAKETNPVHAFALVIISERAYLCMSPTFLPWRRGCLSWLILAPSVHGSSPQQFLSHRNSRVPDHVGRI